MTEQQRPVDLATRVQELAQQLEEVQARLSALETRDLQPGALASPAAEPTQPTADADRPKMGLGDGVSTLLGRLAVACFLLVVALVLRTLADSDLLRLETGIWFGLGYATALCCVGWFLFLRGSGQAATFCITGAALLGSVLLEGTFRHQVVAPGVAYGLLMAMSAGTGVAVRKRPAEFTLAALAVVALGVGGALLVPVRSFPLLAALVLVVNGMAGRYRVVPGRIVVRALAWLALVGVWAYWALELSAALQRNPDLADTYGMPWFGPLLLATVLYFAGSTVLEVRRLEQRWSEAFDACLLPLTLGWSHLVATWVLPLDTGAAALVGWAGWAELGTACLLLLAAWRLRSRTGEEAASSAPGLLSVSAAMLLFLGLPVATGSGALSVPVWCAAALGLGRLSTVWRSGGTRVASYLLSVGACAYAFWSRAIHGPVALLLVLAAGLVLAHYRWARRSPPPPSRFFTRVDKRDDTAMGVLLAALGLLFAGLGGAVQPWLSAAGASCVGTVLINLGALALVWWGQRRGVAEVRGVGVLVLGIGAVRVFVFELLASSGLPLVFSVLSFGIAAGVVAVLLKKRGETTVHGPSTSGSTE